jgi:hypothetical protein
MSMCDANQRLVDEIVLGELPPAKWQGLREHLRGCDGCRERYNRVVLAERMLNGGPAALGSPSPAELARIGASLFAEEKRSVWARAAAWLAPTPRWTAAATLALAVLLVPFVVLRRPSLRPADEFQARGTGAPATSMERRGGLRAFCIEGDQVRALDERGRCSMSANLKLTVSNPGRFQRVFVVGVDGERSVKWYAPHPPERESVTAPEGIDAPVGGAVRLGVNHSPGPVRIYALFSDAPVRADEIEAAAAKGTLDKLPLGRADVQATSLVVEVAP